LAGTESTTEALQIKPRNCLSETELGGYLSGLIHPHERRLLNTHLPACAECRRLTAFYRKHKNKFATVLPPELR
jgi:anti-sigma factor RsiW